MRRAAKYTGPALLARAIPERQLQETLRQAFLAEQYLYYHTHRAQHSPAGFPDIIAIRGNRLIVAELKREGEKPTEAQANWLAAFEGIVHITVGLWRPSDLDHALAIIGRKS